MIVCTEFQKIGDFKSQQLEMMYKQIIYMYHSKSIDESYPKNVLFIEFELLSQKFWAFFVKMLAFFTMPTDKIWSCHMIQEANFEHFLFFHNSTFNIKKSHKISNGKSSLLDNLPLIFRSSPV